MNKTIYTTYHSRVPPIVLKRWQELNPKYAIDFSMDVDCIKFLESEFHRNIAELFIYITRGMYKADLWRLCKLYVHGGVYADIDLIPFESISKSITDDPNGPGYFYSCLSLSSPSIFQAFMYNSQARSPLLLGFLVSFLVNKPYTNIDNGPTMDMYNLILYNVQAEAAAESGGTKVIPDALQPFTYYYLWKIRIPIYITSLDEDIVPLHYFPSDVEHSISISPNTRNKWVLANQDKFKMKIENHCLLLNTAELMDHDNDNDSADTNEGFIVDICIKLPELKPEVVYLFQECIRDPSRFTTCYISDCNGKNIMDCRDPNYVRDRGWINQ